MSNMRIYGLAAASAVAMFAFMLPASAEEKVLNVMHAGGQWGDAVAKCVDDLLLKDKGIKVVVETPGGYCEARCPGEVRQHRERRHRCLDGRYGAHGG